MRKAGLLFALAVVFALSASAQQTDRPIRLTVFTSGLGFSYAENAGTNWSGGVGLALEYRWNETWSVEGSLARERHDQVFVLHPFEGGPFVTERARLTTYPVEVTGLYHFDTEGRWKPFLGLGGRYVQGPDSPFGQLEDQLSAQVTGGVHFEITPRLSLRLGAKRLLRGDSPRYDPDTKLDVGLGWRF